MISYLEALSLLEQNAKPLLTEEIKTQNSLGRILSEDIFSPIDLPSFDNSAMDGFALKAEETLFASMDDPTLFLINEVIAAEIQTPKTASLVSCICSQIMTGAAIPLGYDAVIPVELAEEVRLDNRRYIKVKDKVNKFANVRFKGEDVKSSSLILNAGTEIKPSEIMLFLALGIANIKVFKPIDIAIASTGNEISDEYDKPLAYGEIYNSNSPLLINLANKSCFAPRYAGVLQDDSESLCDFIDKSSEQLLITTGAVSKGIWDFIPDTLRKLGAEIIFHSVAIRPGKPILLARLADGRLFLGLPGNPVSSMVGWRFFATPIFYAMWGKKREIPLRLRLKNEFKKNHKLRQFLKAELSIENGTIYAEIANGQESFKIKPLTTSSIWAIVNEQDTHMKSGDLISAVPLYVNL